MSDGLFGTPKEALEWITEQSKKAMDEKKSLIIAIYQGMLVIVSCRDEDVDRLSAVQDFDPPYNNFMTLDGVKYELTKVDEDDED